MKRWLIRCCAAGKRIIEKAGRSTIFNAVERPGESCFRFRSSILSETLRFCQAFFVTGHLAARRGPLLLVLGNKLNS